MSKEKEEQYVDLPQSDVAGFWDGEGTLHFRPQGFRSFKSKKFRDRTTTIIVGTLVSPAGATNKDGDELTLDSGDTIGVWYSPGMRPVLTLKGQKIKITRDETLDRDTGKGNPMKGYAFQTLKGCDRVKLENLSNSNDPDISVQEPKASEPLDDGDVPFD